MAGLGDKHDRADSLPTATFQHATECLPRRNGPLAAVAPRPEKLRTHIDLILR